MYYEIIWDFLPSPRVCVSVLRDLSKNIIIPRARLIVDVSWGSGELSFSCGSLLCIHAISGESPVWRLPPAGALSSPPQHFGSTVIIL